MVLSDRGVEPPDPLREEDVEISLFTPLTNGEKFSCGNADLDRFILTEEAARIEREDLGRTYLVRCRGHLAAYLTLSVDALRMESLRTWTEFDHLSRLRIETMPAIKIGRLAVARQFQSRGLGRHLVNYVVGLATVIREQAGVRLVLLEAKPDSLGFYERCGFRRAFPTRRERARRNRTMFLDLHSVPSAG